MCRLSASGAGCRECPHNEMEQRKLSSSSSLANPLASHTLARSNSPECPMVSKHWSRSSLCSKTAFPARLWTFLYWPLSMKLWLKMVWKSWNNLVLQIHRWSSTLVCSWERTFTLFTHIWRSRITVWNSALSTVALKFIFLTSRSPKLNMVI